MMSDGSAAVRRARRTVVLLSVPGTNDRIEVGTNAENAESKT